jgi:prepilin-type N-terminal cleavage/methylation domain-containing protein
MGTSFRSNTESRRTSRDQAFTLVELLVVIGIIALLVAATLPTIASSVANARAVQCQSNVRVICQQLINYASCGRGKFPPNVTAPANCWWYQTTGIISLTPNPLNDLRGPVATCPEDSGAQRSYAMNVWASSRMDASVRANNPQTTAFACSAKNNSKLILVSEAWSAFGNASSGWVSPAAIGVYGPTPGRRFGGSGGVSYLAGRFNTIMQSELDFSRHRLVGRSKPQSEPAGRIVIGYVDGHVALKSTAELVTALGTSTLDSWWSPSDAQANR